MEPFTCDDVTLKGAAEDACCKLTCQDSWSLYPHHELGTHRCDNAERSLKAPSGTTEMSFPCKELKQEKENSISYNSESSEKSPCMYMKLQLMISILSQ